MKKQGSNINTIKADNNSLILNCVRRRAMSRAEISKLTGLTKSAVTVITKQLIEDEQLTETGTESISLGRHPILLDIVENHRYAMGISLHRREISVCAVNLKLKSIDGESCNIENFTDPEGILEWAYKTGMRIFERNGLETDKCIGIGISSPGPVDCISGKILTPPNFDIFRNFGVKEFFRGRTDLPVLLNNAPVLMAMYEQYKRIPEIKNYIFISVDNGVGSAIVQNGVINMGYAGFSGEIGHITVDINGPVCSCGNIGCLEGYITEKAIRKNFRIASYKELIDAAYSGDAASLRTVEKIADYFAAGIVNTVNLFDLEAVIISGELNYRNGLLFDMLQKRIDSRSIIADAHSVKILPSLGFSGNSVAYAASNVINRYFNQEI